ncbi:hypothetical protein LCL95_01185 [Bacillus timonensis]|nr:hypothetical protein [Bacillus timonensis]
MLFVQIGIFVVLVVLFIFMIRGLSKVLKVSRNMVSHILGMIISLFFGISLLVNFDEESSYMLVMVLLLFAISAYGLMKEVKKTKENK